MVAVLHNNDLNQVTWEMRAMSGSPTFAESQSIPSVNDAAFASSLGLHAVEIHRSDALSGTWSAAFASDRPTVLDVHTDPDFPTIPPHTTFEQAKDTARAILSGDPDAWGIVRAGVREKIQEILPSR